MGVGGGERKVAPSSTPHATVTPADQKERVGSEQGDRIKVGMLDCISNTARQGCVMAELADKGERRHGESRVTRVRARACA